MQQTLFGEGGNCLQACIASVFDLPLEDVPHLFRNSKSEDTWFQWQWDQLRSFAASVLQKGVTWLDPETDRREVALLEDLDCYYLACGPTVTGGKLWHWVVMLNGAVVHDPSYKRALPGIAGPPQLYIVFTE